MTATSDERFEAITWEAITWRAAKGQLKREIGADAFGNWIRPLEPGRDADGKLVLVAPTRFLRDWVMTHYGERLLALCRAHDKTVNRLAIIVRPPPPSPPAADPELDWAELDWAELDWVESEPFEGGPFEAEPRWARKFREELREIVLRSREMPTEPPKTKNTRGASIDWERMLFLQLDDLAARHGVKQAAQYEYLREVCRLHHLALPQPGTIKKRRREMLKGVRRRPQK